MGHLGLRRAGVSHHQKLQMREAFSAPLKHLTKCFAVQMQSAILCVKCVPPRLVQSSFLDCHHSLAPDWPTTGQLDIAR